MRLCNISGGMREAEELLFRRIPSRAIRPLNVTELSNLHSAAHSNFRLSLQHFLVFVKEYVGALRVSDSEGKDKHAGRLWVRAAVASVDPMKSDLVGRNASKPPTIVFSTKSEL